MLMAVVSTLPFMTTDKPKDRPDVPQTSPSCSFSPSPEDQEIARSFRELWCKVTDDNYLTLFGFRRFRTSHLLNLRYLEEEIDKLDHQVFQAGVRLGHTPTPTDKLGLRHAKEDSQASRVEDIITKENVLKLRELLKEYGKQE